MSGFEWAEIIVSQTPYLKQYPINIEKILWLIIVKNLCNKGFKIYHYYLF